MYSNLCSQILNNRALIPKQNVTKFTEILKKSKKTCNGPYGYGVWTTSCGL